MCLSSEYPVAIVCDRAWYSVYKRLQGHAHLHTQQIRHFAGEAMQPSDFAVL